MDENGLWTGARAGPRPRSRSSVRLRRRTAAATALGATLGALAAIVAVGPGTPEPARPVRPSAIDPRPTRRTEPASRGRYERVRWRDSLAVGRPSAGALVRGTKLPAEGQHFFSWDPERRRSPSPWWRRYATDRLIRVVLRVADDFARAHPRAPRLTIGDLSRPRGGHFGARYSSRPLHASHQNGLDVDVYYPRRDRRERAASRVSDVDLGLAQDLVDRFVRAGARFVFVGPHTRLTGPRRIVQPLPRHDNHLHVRLPPAESEP